MTHRPRTIHPSNISEIDRLLLSPGIGGCRWPPSSWLERHRYAIDHHGADLAPLHRQPPRSGSRLLLILMGEVRRH